MLMFCMHLDGKVLSSQQTSTNISMNMAFPGGPRVIETAVPSDYSVLFLFHYIL